MGKKTATAAHFGARLMQLLGDRSIADAVRETGIQRWVWDKWKKRADPPQGQRLIIQTAEKWLGGRLTNDDGTVAADPIETLGGIEMRENRMNYGEESRRRRVVIQPLDFKKKALDATGRARHRISRLLARFDDVKEISPTEQEIIEALQDADNELARAQSHLMGQIPVNDEGEPV